MPAKKPKRPLIIDSGFFIALGNRRDKHHDRAVKLTTRYTEYDWVTTWPVITEVVHLLPPQAGLSLLKAHGKGFFRIYQLADKDLSRITDLFERYQKERINLADLSLVVLAERLGTGDILTCDRRDFAILKWNRNRSFHNCFLDS